MPILTGPLPTEIHSTAAVSTETARDYLSHYLDHSEVKPYLHPDSPLGVNGVAFSPHGSSGGIILHLLRRVERGLAGEVLEPEPEPDDAKADDDAALNSQISPSQPARGRRKREEALGWEDPDQYALEQGIVEGHEMDSNFVRAHEHVPVVEPFAGPAMENSDGVAAEGKMKEKSKARKDAKKARRKETKKLKVRKRMADVDDKDEESS
jgi:hypothetical protein